jgi:hypothetical protein
MKHLKTSFTDLHRLFRNNITIREIAEPLVSFESDRTASIIGDFMEKKDFDVVGVRQEGEMFGYVTRQSLGTGRLSDYVVPFDDENLLDENASLHSALEFLKDREWGFVQFLNCPVGIITRGDLQKSPVRMWLFGLISLLEMRLLQRIREHYPESNWLGYLNEKRQSAAREVLELRNKKNEGIDLAECLQLCDKKTIYGKSNSLQNLYPFDSRKKWNDFMDQVEKLRNSLAHSNAIAFGSWPEVAALVDDIEKCLVLLERGFIRDAQSVDRDSPDEQYSKPPTIHALIAKEIYLDNKALRKGVATGDVSESNELRPDHFERRDKSIMRRDDWFEYSNGYGVIVELFTKYYGPQSDKHKVWVYDIHTKKSAIFLDFQLGQSGLKVMSPASVPDDIKVLFSEYRNEGDHV